MPRFGTLDSASYASAATIDGYKTEEWTLKGVQLLEIHHEIDDNPADALVPRAMHPCIPEYAIIDVLHAPDSPAGEFTLASLRIAGRTGVHPRGFMIKAYCSNDKASRELASRWGFPVTTGDVSLVVRHDRVVGKASAGGKTVLEVELIDRDAISGTDVQYIASMHLARNKEDGKLVLVQVDPDYTFHKAERGRQQIRTFDAAAFGVGSHARFMNPISASFATVDMTLPKIRYVCDPEKPALQGTTKVAA